MKPLIIIAGPTACGKTSVSIELAKQLNGSIISADSMQVYKYMDIGTAKIKKDEMNGIKHYLIDELMPDEEFSAAIFQRMAKKAYFKIMSENKIPMLVGGTGFYLNSFLYNTDFSIKKTDYTIRNELTKLAEEKGNDFIYNMLKDIDSDYANIVHKNNLKKVIRAIEYYKETGEKFSVCNSREKRNEPVYNYNMFILNMDRERLYKRIEKRIDIMIEDGLINEVKSLLDKYSRSLVSMQGLGYKEIASYLYGECSLDEAIYILKRDTRRFAKRQLTWFKHQCDGTWVNVDDFDSISDVVNYIISKITI